ncbi:hypothetical protein FACS1894103_4270 [Campylobacterota bacterium]|nr:hypothetical protein FACS1894103_4270 [Campylobacterota bacterium]
MKSLAAFLLCALSLWSVDWLTDYDDALALSQESGKPMLVVIMRESCPYCRMLITDTLPSEPIDKLIAQAYIPVMLDTEANPVNVAKSALRANAVPASYIVQPNGVEKQMLIGYRPPMEFMRFLQNGSN